jgi:hypothetical protein
MLRIKRPIPKGEDVAEKDDSTKTKDAAEKKMRPEQVAKIVLGSVVGFFVLFLFLYCLNSKSSLGQKRTESTIPYQIVKSVKRLDGKLIMEVIVSETASQKEVLDLAENLRQEYAGAFASIIIFDSHEAWRRHLDMTYPEEELSKHWLVNIADFLGGEEVRWVAEGRGQHPAP